MEISEETLRAMVREAIARHSGQPPGHTPAAVVPILHASHARLTLLAGGDPDGRCLIEPAVPCSHCGYCQSMGH